MNEELDQIEKNHTWELVPIPHDKEMDFDLVDLDQQDDHEASSLVVKEKDAQIRELKPNLDRSKFVISFMQVLTLYKNYLQTNS